MRTYLTVGLPFSRLTCDEEIKSMEGINNILVSAMGDITDIIGLIK